LSPLLNHAWLALAFLAAWCVGRPFGVAAVSLMGAAAVLGTPEIVLDEGGSGLNDVVGVAMLLAAIAVLVNCRRGDDRNLVPPAALACAATAAGLALGTKFTLIAPVGALTLGVIVLSPRGERARRAALWLTIITVTGGYWYLRNLITVGNALPSLDVGVGPLRLPSVPTLKTFSVSEYLLDGHVWKVFFRPGLREAFGPAWWMVFAAAGAGCLLAVLLGPGRWARMIALVGIASFVAYLFSPQILGPAPVPTFFVVNLRYVAPALLIGVVLLPVAAVRFGHRSLWVLMTVYGGILVATQFDGTLWNNAKTIIALPTEGSSPRVWGALIGIGAFSIAITTLELRSHATRWCATKTHALPVACISIAALLGGGYALERTYLRNRYTGDTASAGSIAPAIHRWARDTHDARIAIAGFFLQYPLYGSDLSNHVQYLARRQPDGASSQITTCEAWRRAVNDGRYDYVVATGPGFPFTKPRPSVEVIWTRSDPAAHLLVHDASAWIFRIDGRLDAARCP
jgi:hypothetical protein